MLGFYNINKPTGATSTQMVSLVKRVTHNKCGHLGTLDPMASGVLPVAVGKATKLFDWFLNKDKKYYAIGLFGVLTDTLDAEGTVQQKQEVEVTKQQIDNIIHNFKGKIQQKPPLYSSVSINGSRAYDLARQGKDFQLPTRSVNIYNVECAGQIEKNLFAFNIHCSAGTYVRSLILDIAKKLGTIATTVCIIRMASGPFNMDTSYTPEQITNNQAELITIDKVIDLPKINLQSDLANKLLNGQAPKISKENGKYLCYTNNTVMGIAKVEDSKIKLEINLWENAND